MLPQEGELFRLLEEIKLWSSRSGLLHGIKSIEARGPGQVLITTYCNRTFAVTDSRNSRAARWLRNKWYREVCPRCAVPEWKLAKYGATRFRRGFDSKLEGKNYAGDSCQSAQCSPLHRGQGPGNPVRRG